MTTSWPPRYVDAIAIMRAPSVDFDKLIHNLEFVHFDHVNLLAAKECRTIGIRYTHSNWS